MLAPVDLSVATNGLQIGPYKLSNRLILAPMAGVTDRPFRQLCRRLGAGLAVSEMVTADASLWGTRKTVRRLDHEGEAAPISVQIVGADPDMLAEAARANVDFGAQIIDINMGCPAKKVCRVAAGSALLRDEALVARILARVVAAVDVPVTLKIRTGWDREHRNALRIARIAEQQGVVALAIHGRTRACRFEGNAEYDTIRAVKASVDIPVIANGDVGSPVKAESVLRKTGADALMIGRAAQGRPWIFQEIERYLRSGRLPQPPRIGWVRDLLLEHIENLYHFYGVEHGVKVARKHIGWYTKGQRNSTAFRQKIYAVEDSQEQIRQIRCFFDSLENVEELAA